MIKKITSVTMHTTSEGQRLSFTYSVIDANSGAVISENNRESLVVLDIPANKEVLESIANINSYIDKKMEV